MIQMKRLKKITAVAIVAAVFFMPVCVFASATTRSIPTSGGNRNVTYVEIRLDETYTVNAVAARDTFGNATAPLSDYVEYIQQHAGTDTVIFPVNFFTTGDGTNEVVGALISQGRIVSLNPQPWLNQGVGFTADNRMVLYSGRVTPEGHIYGEHWNSPRITPHIVTTFNIYPHLIANGERLPLIPAEGSSQQFLDSRVQRAFMGQRADGTLVVGNVSGTNVRELQDIALELNLVTATNIDGGASASLWRNGTYIMRPGRQLASVAYVTNNRAGSSVPPVSAAAEIGVTINGTAVNFGDQPPAVVDGRTLVPIRAVFEALNFTVNWHAETEHVVLSRDDFVVSIGIGNDSFLTNEISSHDSVLTQHALDVPAQIINGRTMLPIRAVLESVGYNVDWNNDTRTVVITN
jgi:hypothetical protein